MKLFLLFVFCCFVSSLDVISDFNLRELEEEERHVMIMVLENHDENHIHTFQQFSEKNKDLEVLFKYTTVDKSHELVKSRHITAFPAFVMIIHHNQKDKVLQGGFDLAKLQQFFDISTLPIINYFVDPNSVTGFTSKQYTTSFLYERNQNTNFDLFFNEFTDAAYEISPLVDTKFYYTETASNQFQLLHFDNMRFSDETQQLVYNSKSNLTIERWMSRVAFPLFSPLNENIAKLLKLSAMKAIVIVNELDKISKEEYLELVFKARNVQGHIGFVHCEKGSHYDQLIGGQGIVRVVDQNLKFIESAISVDEAVAKFTSNDHIGILSTYTLQDDFNPLYDIIKMVSQSPEFEKTFKDNHLDTFFDSFMHILANKTLTSDILEVMSLFSQIEFSDYKNIDVDEIVMFFKNEKLWHVVDALDLKNSNVPLEVYSFIHNFRKVVHDEATSKPLEVIIRRVLTSPVIRSFFEEHINDEQIRTQDIFVFVQKPEVKLLLSDIETLMTTIKQRELLENKREL